MLRPRLYSFSQLLLLVLLVSGCLPSSCNRTESRDLLPADSLSREFAATVPVDTLAVLGWIEAGEMDGLGYPRTVAFDSAGDLWISDTDEHALTRWREGAGVVESISAESYSFPYIAGFRGDTVLVFSAGTSEIVKVVGGEAVARIPVPTDAPERGVFRYAAADETRLYLKVIAENFTGYIAQLDAEGRVLDRWALEGPYWQYAGLLRFFNGAVTSLSGYRPMIHVLEDSARVATVSLFGFDSPMLARSRLFVLGEQAQPPLLTASAAGAGDFLFVLNMRPGWLRVDVYNAGGRLERILIQPAPEFNQNYYPSDLAVKQTGALATDGGREFQLAVAVIEPEPHIERYSIWIH